MFNKSAFNQTQFNTTPQTELVDLYATIASEYSLEIQPLKVKALLPVVSMSGIYGIDIRNVGLKFPMAQVIMASTYDIITPLYAYMPITPATAAAEYETAVNGLRSYETEQMTLQGLNLKPGQTLVIDTDTLEIEIDGEPRVDCWVTGGTFFQFRSGDNQLVFTDDANSRDLSVTVVWADRFL